MKVCVVASGLKYPRTIGGLVHQTELCKSLARRGHEVHLISQSLGPFHKDVESSNVIVHKVVGVPISEPFDKILIFFKTFFLLLKLGKKHRFQMIHDRGYLFGGMGSITSLFTHTPVVFQVDDNWFRGIELHGTHLPKLHRLLLVKIGGTAAYVWLKWFILPNVDRFVCVSNSLKKMMIDSWRVDEDRIVVIPNAANLNLFNPTLEKKEIRARYNLNNRFTIVFVGEIAPWQGLRCLLEATKILAEKCPSLLTLIVGGIPRPGLKYYESVVSYSKQLGLAKNVKFLGVVPYLEVPRIIAAADAAVAPFIMISKDIGFSPLKIFEYMASGKPIIASKIDWIQEILVNGVNALLVEPGNPKQLAEAILKLYMDENLSSRLGIEARRTAEERFSWDHIAEKNEEIYYNLMNLQEKVAKKI